MLLAAAIEAQSINQQPNLSFSLDNQKVPYRGPQLRKMETLFGYLLWHWWREQGHGGCVLVEI